MSTKRLVITEKKVREVLATIDAGLSDGLGDPIPGHMCVEAAVCYGLGLPHSDQPSCVDRFIRFLKISLNDLAIWESNQDRAKGLRRLGLVQLGSQGHFNESQFKSLFNTMLKRRYYDRLDRFKLGQEDSDDDGVLIDFIHEIVYCKSYARNSRAAHILCEHFVQIFVKMKLPGVKWLKLAPLPKKKRSVKK